MTPRTHYLLFGLAGWVCALLFLLIVQVGEIAADVHTTRVSVERPVVCTLNSAGETTLAQSIADAIMATSPAE